MEIEPPAEGRHRNLSGGRISNRVRNLIDSHFRSVGHLELFLFLQRNRVREWSVAELSREMRTNESLVLLQLADLGKCVRFDRAKEVVIAGDDEAVLECLEEIEHLHSFHRQTLIAALYERPLETIRSFADAFKLKKEE